MKEKLIQFLTDVGSHYGKELSEFSFTVWLNVLEGYDLETIGKAFNSYAKNPDAFGRGMPSTNEILREIHGRAGDSSELAWGKALKAIERVGKGNDVVFDDALIHASIQDMGGWVKFCSVLDDEVKFHRLQFVKTYQAHRASGQMPEYPRLLTGTNNLHNSANGFRCSPPLLIGDPQKARDVLENGCAGGGLKITTATDEIMKLAFVKAKEVA